MNTKEESKKSSFLSSIVDLSNRITELCFVQSWIEQIILAITEESDWNEIKCPTDEEGLQKGIEALQSGHTDTALEYFNNGLQAIRFELGSIQDQTYFAAAECGIAIGCRMRPGVLPSPFVLD